MVTSVGLTENERLFDHSMMVPKWNGGKIELSSRRANEIKILCDPFCNSIAAQQLDHVRGDNQSYSDRSFADHTVEKIFRLITVILFFRPEVCSARLSSRGTRLPGRGYQIYAVGCGSYVCVCAGSVTKLSSPLLFTETPAARDCFSFRYIHTKWESLLYFIFGGFTRVLKIIGINNHLFYQ